MRVFSSRTYACPNQTASQVFYNSFRFSHAITNLFEAKQEEFHNAISEKLSQFRAPKITMDHKEEIVSYIQRNCVKHSLNIIEKLSTDFINTTAQNGTYHALSNPYSDKLNLVDWYINKYIDFSLLPEPLSSQDALKYSRPESIEYDEQLRFIPLGFDIKYYGNHSFIKIENNLGGCYTLLPNQNKEKKGKKLLLLDLDGSLIDYNVERPYLKEYLQFLSTRFEIGIHSTGYDMDELIDKWNRKYCNGNIMYYICKSHKFLSTFAINRSHFLHLDDTEGSNQYRWIKIKQFNRSKMEDDELHKLMEWLQIYHDFDGNDYDFVEMFPPSAFLQQE